MAKKIDLVVIICVYYSRIVIASIPPYGLFVKNNANAAFCLYVENGVLKLHSITNGLDCCILYPSYLRYLEYNKYALFENETAASCIEYHPDGQTFVKRLENSEVCSVSILDKYVNVVGNNIYIWPKNGTVGEMLIHRRFCSYLVSLKTLDGNCVGDNDATFHTAPSINGSCCHANGTNVLFYYAGFKLKNDMGKYLDVNGYREKLEWKGWSMHTFLVLSNLNKKLKWYNTNFCLHMDTNFTLAQCDSANILLEDCFSHSFSTYVAQTSKNLGISAIYSNLPTSDGVNCLSFDLNGVVNTKQEHLPEQCCAYTTNILTYDNYMTFKSLRMEAFLGINFQNMPWTIENIEKTNALENSEEEVKNYFFISSKGDVKPHQLPFCLEYNSTSEKIQVLEACQNSLKFQSCEPEVLYPSISTWYVSTTSWYTTIYEPHKWHDARSMCQMLDAELASVEHFLEFDKINQVIKANNFVYWVGLELNISATWSWTDSSLLITEYLPVGSFGSCGAYETPGDSFISKNCDLNLPFICKKSGSTFYHDFNSCNEAQGWKQFNNHCYKEMKEPLTWSDSQMICEMIGGSLVVIKNACEDEFINTMLNSSKEYWIGLSKNFTDGGYLTTWVDGTNISYSNFAVPKRLLTYNNFNFYVNNTGYWFEQIQDRTTKKSFVCQKTIPHYKLYTTPSTWDQAKATCERHDSHLISILNADENLFIHRLTAGYDSNFFWTGGFRQSSAEEYTWLNGKNMTYENWYFKSSYTPRCVLYVRSVSRWRTEVCSQKAPFICAAGGYGSNRTVSDSLASLPNSSDTAAFEWKISPKNQHYLYVNVGLTWSEAKRLCNDMNASLVEFTMESYTEYTDEMDFISNQLTFGRKDFWVGLRDVNNSIFNWNTGYVSESSPWISTKKSASNLCGVLNSCGIQLINCQNRRPVICQKTSSVIYKTNWIQQDGISFYLSEVKVDYNTAKKICHAVNGSILEFTDECLPTDIPLSAQPYYIGLRYSNITDNFEWETTSLNETSFVNHWPVVGLFQTGNCVVVNQKRIWEIVTCDSRYRFVCKRATISSLFINNTNHCGSCPWKQLENKCYLNINENVTWDDAQAYCHSFQADLVVLNSTDESYFLGNMTGNQIFWVGAKNLHWINGQPYLNTFGASESSCVKFYHLNLSYSFCSENLPFVCQRNKNVVQDTSLFCNTPWILNGNSTCYLFSNKKATWKGAHSICRGYNAFLVAILDNDHHQFLINNAQFDTVGGYWTSYNDIESEGKFVWAAKGPGGGYQSWASGKPDDNDGVKNCVILQSDGWVDMKCNSKFHFICQKNGDFETPASIQRKHFYFHDTPMTYWKAEIIREGVYINENNYYEPKFSFLGQNGFIIVHQQLHGAGNFCLSHGSADVVNGSSPHIAEYNATTSKSCISFKFENRFFIFVDVNHTILCLQYVDSQLTFTDSCVYEVGFTNVSTNLELLSFQGENFTAKEIFYQIAGVDYVWSTDMLAPGEIIKNVGYKLLLNFKGYLTVNDSSNDVIYCLYLTQFDIKSPVKIGIMNDDAIDCIVFHFVDGFFRPAIFEYYGYCLQFSNDELYFTLECIYPAQIKDRNITSSIIFTSIASSFFTIPSTLYVLTSPLTSTESIQATIYSTELFATSSKFTTLNTKTSTLATSTPTHSTTQDSAHWAAWSEWLPCNVVCETGNRTRKRKCINAVESSQCFGSSTMYESCQGIGDCSKYAYTMRRSSCTEFCAETGQICDPLMHMGESISLFKILGFSCSDNSSQSEWKEDYAPYFHKDTKMCSGYKGLPENINCDAKPPSNRIIRLCKCILQDDIGMTEWSPWSSCSATCKGYHVRHRSCAVSGGDTCSRNKTHQSECNEHIPCPVHGGFTEWSVWSNCSKSCNKGERIRTRQCANPSPQSGGFDCHGVKEEVQACGTKRCPINGQWSSWSKLSACTKPCNGGELIRRRYCNNPSPLYGGKYCVGAWNETSLCNTQPCSPAYINTTCTFDMHFDAGLRTVEGSSWKSLEAGILHEMKESYEFRFTNSIIGIHLFSARPGSIEAGFTINYTSIDSYQLIYLQDSIESDLGIGKMAIVSGSSWNYVSNIVPSSAPPNITITSNTPTSLNVTWKRLPTSQQNGDVKGYLLFYREKLYLSETYQVFSTRDMHQEITGLKPFTKYVMRLLAYTSAGNGVASDLLTAVTMETKPSQPPTKINGFAINSTAVFLEWMGVPVEHISGIPVGYLVFYEQDGMVFNMTQDFNTPNIVIVGLHASTQYIFTVCACNKVGDGPCDSTEITTASSVPTTIPTGLTLTHRDHDVATFKWTQATTYDFDGYKLQYQLIERNNEVVRNSETVEIHLAPSMTSYTINFLKSNSKYLVLLFAYNAVGSGRPASLTMETCRCREYVEANYFFKPPYVFQTAKTEQLSGIVPVVINNLIHNVCGFCARAGNKRTTVDFVSNGKFGFSCKPNINRVVEDIDDFTEISFPLSSNPIPDDNGNISSVYVPLLKYPGAVLILRDDGMASHVTKIVADIFKVWPIFLLNIILILISGILIWALENYRSADNDFSTNIIKGMCQGLYWAYVTQTTLGYGDITPRKVSSRVLAICWITLSLVMTSLLLGALTSTFTAVQNTKTTSVYGLKVAALSGSFEERLALLRNGKVDKSARYSTVHDLLSALNSGHVSGILLDVYTAASNKDILNNEEYRAVNLLKFPRTYGVVFSGTLANVERLAVDYVAAHQTEILAVVDDFTENIVLQKKIKEKSIFDPRSKFLHRFLLALVITLVVFIVIGYSGWWFVVKRRRLRTVYPQNLSEHLKREKEMLQHLDQITHNFYQTFRHKIDTLFSRMQTERVKLRLDRGASSLRANHSYKLYMSKQNKALELAEFRFLDTDTDSSRKTEKPASKNGNKSENISTEMCNRLKTPFTPDTSCGDFPQCSNFDANDITISEIDDNSW